MRNEEEIKKKVKEDRGEVEMLRRKEDPSCSLRVVESGRVFGMY
jgi:hypothetical protein